MLSLLCVFLLAPVVVADFSTWIHGNRSQVYKDMLYRYAVVACNVPASCRHQTVKKLSHKHPIDQCDDDSSAILHTTVDCIEKLLLNEPDLSVLPAAVGRGCCHAFEVTSLSCKEMCKNALLTPTLPPSDKRRRVQSFCGGKRDFPGDKRVSDCIDAAFFGPNGSEDPPLPRL